MSGAPAPAQPQTERISGGVSSAHPFRGERFAAFSLLQMLLVVAVLAALGFGWHFWRREALVIYCSHDAIFAEEILRKFEQESGVRIAIRYDTEATKSLGLVELLLREKSAPRCDVFWNNEVLGTMELAEQNVLAPYRGSGWSRIPPAFKDADGRWTGFAARMRVLILNTKTGAPNQQWAEIATPTAAARDLQKFAIAKPLYGTTFTQYVLLWRHRGAAETQAWHRHLREHGAREVNGNAVVKDLVAQGICDAGFTDTDDFFAAKDAGAAVTAQPLRIGGAAAGKTICIPNSVAIIAGTKREAAARQLVDYLLSEQTELALARSASRQIPLGRVAAEALPQEVLELSASAAEAFPLDGLAEARRQCLAWLKAEYRR